ncbi:hypothetical protein CSA17_01280 [bacterium DOLJORAL78_65_58]|nr:MAG: hypothetical protein CSB20_00850 [bacterium DOLZORAL124_64_63]PIE76621.1 MAG: hypothetical protein CSA17_01280 [bacterium DOLJORAL78_65_58]
MNRFHLKRRVLGFLPILLLLLPALPALAQNEIQNGAGPLSLPGQAQPDTVRTNIWLTEALMAEIVASTARVLPPAPAAIQLEQMRPLPEDDLFKSAALRVLMGLGYEVYEGDEDPARQAAVDCVYNFSLYGVELEYPDVGRTLGIWRRWVDRSLSVTAQVNIKMAGSGRLLLSERVTRSFQDRVPGGDLDKVDSSLYPFSSAEPRESGWKGRMEELVVLGTLAGLVAVYFANTGD